MLVHLLPKSCFLNLQRAAIMKTLEQHVCQSNDHEKRSINQEKVAQDSTNRRLIRRISVLKQWTLENLIVLA